MVVPFDLSKLLRDACVNAPGARTSIADGTPPVVVGERDRIGQLLRMMCAAASSCQAMQHIDVRVAERLEGHLTLLFGVDAPGAQLAEHPEVSWTARYVGIPVRPSGSRAEFTVQVEEACIAGGEVPILDPTREAELRSVAEGLVERLVAVFLHDVDRRMSELREGLVGGDCERVRRAAHGIKGSSCQLGVRDIPEAAAAIEHCAAAGNLTGAEERLALIESRCEQLASCFPDSAAD